MHGDDDALARLAAPRARAVEQARAVLLEAQHAHHACERAQQAAHATLVTSERAVREARAAYLRASSVAALRAAERTLVVREAAQRAAVHSLELARRAREVARTTVRQAEQALYEAELGRRAVASRIEARAELVRASTERAREDEADDAHRTAAHARARRTASKTLR